MTKKAQDFEIWSGDTKGVRVTTVDNDEEVVDITGGSLIWRMFTLAGVQVLDKRNDSTAGITVNDAVNGVFTVNLTPGDTASLAGLYKHEAQIVDASGNVSTLLVGKVTIKTDLIV